MLKLSTQTLHPAKKFGIKKAVEMIIDAGFEAIDLSLFDLLNPTSEFYGEDFFAKAKEIRTIAESRGVCFNQAHAPFPSYKEGNEEYNKAVLPAIEKAIEIAAAVGAEQIVVHPTFLEENKKEFNMQFYNGFEPLCRKLGIKIALENMFRSDPLNPPKKYPNVCSIPKEFRDYVDSLDPDCFTACLDIGHCGLVGVDLEEMIETLGGKLTALHIHDNDGIHDMHTMPFTQKIDFAVVARALKKIGYKGDLTLEADEFMARMPKELYPDALRLMRAADAHLRQMIEEA